VDDEINHKVCDLSNVGDLKQNFGYMSIGMKSKQNLNIVRSVTSILIQIKNMNHDMDMQYEIFI